LPHTRHKVHKRFGIAVKKNDDVAVEVGKANVDTPYVPLVRIVAVYTNWFGEVIWPSILRAVVDNEYLVQLTARVLDG
jgi:hypothetical protein